MKLLISPGGERPRRGKLIQVSLAQGRKSCIKQGKVIGKKKRSLCGRKRKGSQIHISFILD